MPGNQACSGLVGELSRGGGRHRFQQRYVSFWRNSGGADWPTREWKFSIIVIDHVLIV